MIYFCNKLVVHFFSHHKQARVAGIVLNLLEAFWLAAAAHQGIVAPQANCKVNLVAVQIWLHFLVDLVIQNEWETIVWIERGSIAEEVQNVGDSFQRTRPDADAIGDELVGIRWLVLIHARRDSLVARQSLTFGSWCFLGSCSSLSFLILRLNFFLLLFSCQRSDRCNVFDFLEAWRLEEVPHSNLDLRKACFS